MVKQKKAQRAFFHSLWETVEKYCRNPEAIPPRCRLSQGSLRGLLSLAEECIVKLSFRSGRLWGWSFASYHWWVHSGDDPPLHTMPGDAEWVPAFCRKPVTLCHQEFTSCAGSVPVRVLAKLVWIWSDFPNLKDLNFSRWWPSVAKTTLSSLQSSLPQLLFNLNHSQLRKIDFLGHFYTFHGAVATNSFWNVPSQQAN